MFSSEAPVNPPPVFVFGETGTGKSTFINILGGEDVAPTSSGISSTTQGCVDYPVTVEGLGRIVFTDTAGLGDSHDAEGQAKIVIEQLQLKPAVKAFLLFFNSSGYRFSKNLQNIANTLLDAIGEENLQYVMVICTHAEGNTMRDELFSHEFFEPWVKGGATFHKADKAWPLSHPEFEATIKRLHQLGLFEKPAVPLVHQEHNAGVPLSQTRVGRRLMDTSEEKLKDLNEKHKKIHFFPFL